LVAADLPASADINLSSALSIPAGQTAGTYTGIVKISWTA